MGWANSTERVASLENFEESRHITEEWIEGTREGQEFSSKFNSNASRQKLVDTLALHGLDVSERSLSWAFKILRDAGLFVTPGQETAAIEEDERASDTRPRDKNGKLLTDLQIRFGEHLRFYHAATAEQTRKRAKTDAAFGEFLRSQIRKENSEVGDAVTNLNAPAKRNEVGASELVRRFAELHQELPAARLKPQGGYVSMAPDMRFTKTQFDDLVAKASAAGLL